MAAALWLHVLVLGEGHESDGGSVVAPSPQSGKRMLVRQQQHCGSMLLLWEEDPGQEPGSWGFGARIPKNRVKQDTRWQMGKWRQQPILVLGHHEESGEEWLVGCLETQSFTSDVEHPRRCWELGLRISGQLDLVKRAQTMRRAKHGFTSWWATLGKFSPF